MTHGPAQDEPIALPLALGLVGLVGAVLTDGLAQWVAVAAVLTAAPSLIRHAAAHPAWQRRRDRIPLALVLVVCVWLLGDLLLGRAPASRDHGIHLYQVHLLLHDLLPRGRVMGWTDQFNNGLPFGEAYPWFPHLWAALPHLLSGGLIPVRMSYAWSLGGMWLLGVLGVWLVAREVAREVTDGSEESSDRASIVAWAGALGALTWLLDPGGSRQGGWNYLMFHGVWPQMLSATLWVLALPLCWRAYRQPSPRRLALATLVLGGSVLAHPFGLLTMACSAAVWLAVLAVVPSASRLPTSRWVAFAVIHLGAAMIGYGWLSSFLAGAEAMGRSPVPWDSIGTMASEIVRGELFGGHAAWSGPLALLGLVAAIRRGGSIAWLVTGLVLGMLVLGSQAAITVLRLDLIVAGFKNLQFPRYSIAIKPLYFALSGVGAAVALGALRRFLAARPSRTIVERFVVGIVLAPFVLSVATEPDRIVTRPVGGIETLEGAGLVEAEADLRQALLDEQAALDDDAMTVAVFRARMGGGTYAVMSVAEVARSPGARRARAHDQSRAPDHPAQRPRLAGARRHPRHLRRAPRGRKRRAVRGHAGDGRRVRAVHPRPAASWRPGQAGRVEGPGRGGLGQSRPRCVDPRHLGRHARPRRSDFPSSRTPSGRPRSTVSHASSSPRRGGVARLSARASACARVATSS